MRNSMPIGRRAVGALGLIMTLAFAGPFIPVAARAAASAADAGTIRYDSAQRMFRIDAGAVTYAFGIDPSGELQTVYWGGALGAGRCAWPGQGVAGSRVVRFAREHVAAGICRLGRSNHHRA